MIKSWIFGLVCVVSHSRAYVKHTILTDNIVHTYKARALWKTCVYQKCISGYLSHKLQWTIQPRGTLWTYNQFCSKKEPLIHLQLFAQSPSHSFGAFCIELNNHFYLGLLYTHVVSKKVQTYIHISTCSLFFGLNNNIRVWLQCVPRC